MIGRNFIRKNYRWLLFFCLLFVLIVSLWNAWKDSAIFDETAHIGAAYSYVEKQDMRLNPEHPPLVKDISGIPLKFLGLEFDDEKDFWTNDINGQWEAGKDLLYEEGNNADKILFFSRLPIIILALILGIFIFKWGKELLGIYGGFLIFILYAFDPNILGHNHYVTTDLAIAAFLTFAFYYFLKFVKKPSWKSVWFLGFFLGLLQLSKFSSIVAFPVMALILLIYPLVIVKEDKKSTQLNFRMKRIGGYILKFFLAFSFSLIVVFFFYVINTYKMPKEKVANTINHYFSSELNEQKNNQLEIGTNKVLNYLNEKPVLGKPLAYYGLGISMVFKRVSGGNSIYYLGQISNEAFSSYFPVVFLAKQTFYHLILYILAILISAFSFFVFLKKCFRTKVTNSLSKIVLYIRNNIDSTTLFLFVLLYSYVSITGNLNLGIRHLFPILPFVYILTVKVILKFLKKSLNKRKDFVIEISLLIISFLIVFESFLAFPFYLSYFNPLGGGVYGGYRIVTDSNSDWGQDLKRLEDFLDERPYIEKIRVDYFGGGDINYYLQGKEISWWDSRRPVEVGWYAISVGYIQSSLFDDQKTKKDNYEWLGIVKPVAKAGTSIFIYYISQDDLKKINNFSNGEL